MPPEFVEAVTAELLAAVDETAAASPPDPAFTVLFDELRALIRAGGKRVRPTFCLWGYRAAGGCDLASITRAAAALEFVHVCAIVHDDIMDAATLRRGRPTAHVAFTTMHRSAGWDGDQDHFGTSAAIMLGDLAFVLADRLLANAEFPESRRRAAFDHYTSMRIEVVLGQYLDLVEGNRRGAGPDAALAIAGLKTSKYTVERPLLVGASLGGASRTVAAVLSAYGRPLGLAFQLRDDLLGAFGREAVTGKPEGMDFREGKQTYLVARAGQLGTAAHVHTLDTLLGKADLTTDEVDELRSVLRDSGSVEDCEARIAELTGQAIDALGPATAEPTTTSLAGGAAAALTELAHAVAFRDR